MYATCMFCNRSLGDNRVVEHFPIGRRLAFDAHRGRLWVVCRKCERWNLTPIEERWEAIETCERLFRATRVRVSSENVGLACHPEGLELVRIGEPMRPEFAAWRYGDQFGRRRKRAILYGVGGAAIIGAVAVAGVAGGIGASFVAQIPGLFESRTLVKVRTKDGRVLKLNNQDLKGTRLRAPSGGDGGFELWLRRRRKQHHFDGEEARKLAGMVLPKINRKGGRRDTIQGAVAEIEQFGHPEAFLADVVTGRRFQDRKGVPGYVNKMPAQTKLALEMALHEEQERRALEGELWRLERAWEEAEEIAAISDSLLLPEGTDSFLEEHRERRPTAGGVDGERAQE
jgi:hypothetical protein